MKRWAVFYGGGTYRVPEATDAEEFDSLKAVKNCYYWPLHDGDSYYPCVDEDAEVLVWNRCPHEEADPYPDLIIKAGPRGGLIVEPC